MFGFADFVSANAGSAVMNAVSKIIAENMTTENLVCIGLFLVGGGRRAEGVITQWREWGSEKADLVCTELINSQIRELSHSIDLPSLFCAGYQRDHIQYGRNSKSFVKFSKTTVCITKSLGKRLFLSIKRNCEAKSNLRGIRSLQ